MYKIIIIIISESFAFTAASSSDRTYKLMYNIYNILQKTNISDLLLALYIITLYIGYTELNQKTKGVNNFHKTHCM